MSQNRGNPRGGRGRPTNRPEDPRPDPDVPNADPDSDDPDAEIGDTNWESGNYVYTERRFVRVGFREGNEVVPGQLPEVTERRVFLQNSPTTRRRSLQQDQVVAQRQLAEGTERLVLQDSPTLRRRSFQQDAIAQGGTERRVVLQDSAMLRRSSFQDDNEIAEGHGSPTLRRRRFREGNDVQGQESPTLRRRRSLRSVMEHLSPRALRRSSQIDSPARSGSEPPTSRRDRGTQTPPMDRKWGPYKKPEDPKK